MTSPSNNPGAVRRAFLYWAPALLWCGVIFHFSSIPDLSTDLGFWDLPFRKAVHAAEFALLSGLIGRALRATTRLTPKMIFTGALTLSAAYAASDEWHQSFVPGRGPSLIDVCIDAAGAFAAAFWQYRKNEDIVTALWRRNAKLFLPVCLLLLGGCGRVDYLRARHLEKSGRQEAALKLYLDIADNHPGRGVAPEALLKASRLATEVMGDHDLARELCLRIIDQYGAKGNWSRKAELALLNSPNYFPLVDGGEWDEGDSATGGEKFLVQTVSRRDSQTPSFVFVRKIYVNRAFRADLSSEVSYLKTGGELKEFSSGGKSEFVPLRHPLSVGNRWSSQKGGREISYVVVSTGAAVEVRAGRFEACLKVREDDPREKSPHFIYYAPWVGRILATEVSGGSERRLMELVSFDLANADGSELKYLKRGLFSRSKKKPVKTPEKEKPREEKREKS